MIKIAKEKYPTLSFSVMDMQKMQYPDDTFDAVVSLYSILHIPNADIPRALKETNRILKQKGYLEIIVQKGEGEKIVEEPLMRSEKMFFNLFTKKQLEKFLTDGGFKIILSEEEKNWDEDCIGDYLIHIIAQK